MKVKLVPTTSYKLVVGEKEIGTFTVSGEAWNGMAKLQGTLGIVIVEDWRQRLEHMLSFGKESEAETELLKASPDILARIGS